MIELLDYVLDENSNFWIVNALYDNVAYGYMVYQVNEEGERYNNITKKTYSKCMSKTISKIPKELVVFKPNIFYLEHKKELQGIWRKFAEVLNYIGIRDDDIGIFGSYLIGFDIVKDIDFIIYGKDNLKKYLDNKKLINSKLKVTNISPEHIDYQCNKFKDYFATETDIRKVISRNITGIQIKKGVLSTPRFIDKNYTNIPFDNGKREILNLKVVDGTNTLMIPRRAKVLYNEEEYELISPIWKYEGFLRKKDNIIVRGCLLKEKKQIVLYNYEDYVKFVENEDVL